MRPPPPTFDPPIVGSSPSTTHLRRTIARIADSPVNVLVTGESGTGKELVARNLHRNSARRDGPFVAVNCAALNIGVLESELFGHGRGAFTGAVRSHAGLFEQADGGTLFLDEVAEVPGFVQAKLLRALQEREIRRMGGDGVRHVDVRVIAATNADLTRKVAAGSFRVDLFYRLAVVEMKLAPLCERPEDIFLLVDHFFERRESTPPRISPDVRGLFLDYRWPGNVRELENELERVLAFHPRPAEITLEMLSPRVRNCSRSDALDMKLLYDKPLPQAVGYLEENLLRKTLARTNWNKSRSARELGLSRQGLLKKMRRYGIFEEPDPDSAETGG